MGPEQQLIAQVEEHAPECARMLKYVNGASEGEPLNTSQGPVIFDDDEFVVVAMACKVYAEHLMSTGQPDLWKQAIQWRYEQAELRMRQGKVTTAEDVVVTALAHPDQFDILVQAKRA